MAKIATEVYLIIRGEQLSGDKSLQDKVNKSEKIEVCKSYQTTEIKGEQKVESIRIKNLNTGKERELKVKAIFIEIGLIPNTGFICEDLEVNQGNEIIIDANILFGGTVHGIIITEISRGEEANNDLS